MVSITRPNSPDLSVRNAKGKVYVTGDDTTDGSLRFAPSETNPGAVKVELRADAVWDRTAMDIAASTLHIGHDLSIAASGEWLHTFSVLHDHNSLFPHVHFTDDGGTSQLHSPLISLKYARELIQPDFGDEVVGNNLTETITVPHTALYSAMYLKGGSVAATEPVTVVLRRDSPTGDIFFKRTYPESLFTSGKMGDITSVTDPSSPGDSVITSVTDNGAGLALFHTLVPQNLVVGSNVREGVPPYVGSYFVTNVPSTTSFETGQAYIGNATGTYSSVEIEVHTATDGLQNGEAIRIFDTASYNGGHTVYDVKPGSYRVTRQYVDDETGGWLASADIFIDLRGDISADEGGIWYASLTSDAQISVVTDSVGKWWAGSDLQLSDIIDVNLDNQLFTAEGDVIINDEANYVISSRFQSGTYSLNQG